MRVHPLPDDLAARIAAGESVNRPCSVVKELMENSIDAGATDIHILIKHGGIKQISLSDNGQGIHPDDLTLAISRYCTSKIKSDTDLEQVMSLGFRGEALASIAAVSRLTIRSKQNDQEHGYQIQVEGSEKIGDISPCPQQKGTSIDVEDLFYNVPARRKFLRHSNTERQHIIAIVQQTAIAHPHISISLKDEKKELIRMPAAKSEQECLERIGCALGRTFIDQSHHITSIDSGLTLKGWIGNPSIDKTNTDSQYFYINGRFVKDKLVRHAIRSAYEDVLFNGRHPCYVLFLDIPPQSVDANVHPTKHEVRFRDQKLVYGFLKQAIADALSSIAPGHTVRIHHQKPQETADTTQESKAYATPNVSVTRERAIQTPRTTHAAPAARPSSTPAFQAKTAPLSLNDDEESTPPFATALAQLHQLYILAQNDDGLIIVDMHAAHERVLYEKMKQDFANQSIAVQPLLIPDTVELDAASFAIWESAKDDLTRCGIETDSIAANTCIIKALPAIIKAQCGQSLLLDLLQEKSLIDTAGDQLTHRIHALLGNIACKAAIKANQALTLPQMQALLNDMTNTPRSGLCNHGRPTVMLLSIKELDQFFMRGK